MTTSRRPGTGLPRASGEAAGRAGDAAPRTRRVRPWLLAGTLALFALVPLLARVLVALAGGPSVAAADGRLTASVALILHAVTGTAFTVLGAFQFPTALRRRGRGASWHPRAGRLLVPLGLIAGLSALWLTLFYSHADGAEQLLYAFRLVFGAAMVACVVAGYLAIRRHHVVRHRAWMIRSYALGLGASTQIVTLGFGGALFGTGELATALLTGAGWVVNLAVAEWAIRRRAPRAAPRGTVVSGSP